MALYLSKPVCALPRLYCCVEVMSILIARFSGLLADCSAWGDSPTIPWLCKKTALTSSLFWTPQWTCNYNKRLKKKSLTILPKHFQSDSTAWQFQTGWNKGHAGKSCDELFFRPGTNKSYNDYRRALCSSQDFPTYPCRVEQGPVFPCLALQTAVINTASICLAQEVYQLYQLRSFLDYASST